MSKETVRVSCQLYDQILLFAQRQTIVDLIFLVNKETHYATGKITDVFTKSKVEYLTINTFGRPIDLLSIKNIKPTKDGDF